MVSRPHCHRAHHRRGGVGETLNRCRGSSRLPPCPGRAVTEGRHGQRGEHTSGGNGFQRPRAVRPGQRVSAVVNAPELRTVRSEQEFLTLEREWDRLVGALERPTPFLLHGWCTEWLRRHGEGCRLAAEIAVADGR